MIGKNPNERGVWGLEAKKYKLANSEMKALDKGGNELCSASLFSACGTALAVHCCA